MTTALAFADDEDPRPANNSTAPISLSPDAPNSRSTNPLTPPIPPPSSGLKSTDRQARIDTRNQVAVGLTSPVAPDETVPKFVTPQGNQTTGGHITTDTQALYAAGSDVPDPAANGAPAPNEVSLLDPALSLAADILDDLERVRIANENRLRQLTRTGEDADGEERGFGYDETHPDVARLAAMVETLAKVEHDATLNLQRKLRKHPLGPWVKAQRGIGEKQGARLLAAIGDPYINSAKGSPRTVSALWAYCGLDPDREGNARRRRKGEKSNWSGNAKMRSHLVAASCIKQLDKDCRDGHITCADQILAAVPAQDDAGRDGHILCEDQMIPAIAACACSPYRVVYDLRRAHTAVTHPEWTDGHSHNDALRIAAKEILKDLWRAARDYHHGATA